MNITEKTNGGLWYFAHPYTVKNKSGDYILGGEAANFQLSCVRSGELIRRGINIYSPISHTHPIHIATPSLIAAEEHELWYQLDNEFIDSVNWVGIILAPGWEDSAGCRAERERIKAKGGQIKTYAEMIELPVIR